ncbi:MAG: T9SS type A sorting domain-containing protein [Bacteroidetes bacterium]|nr:T9SS type A sorting domain-containing protein [Bacteroidota bacterium]
MKRILLLIFIFVFGNLLAQGGDLDTSFNPGTGFDASPQAIVFQPDGKILVGGIFTTYNGVTANRIVRLNPDGSIDNTFVTGTGFDSTVFAFALQPDGKILVGGSFLNYNGNSSVNRVVRLNPDGSLDNTFLGGTRSNGVVRTLVIQPSDGKIIIAGDFGTYDGITRLRIARLNTDGTIDGTFNSTNGSNSSIFCSVLQTDGKILIVGQFTSYGGVNTNRVARVNTDGTLDTGFNNGGSGADGTVNYVTIQPDGKILIGGAFERYNGSLRSALARLNSNGSLDTGFVSNANTVVNAINLQSDGRMIISGTFTDYNGTSIRRIARINPDSTLDPTFVSLMPLSGTITVSAMDANNAIFIGGGFLDYDATSRPRIAKLVNDFTLSLEDSFTEKNGISIFPNPATHSFELITSTKENVQGVEIYNLNGQQVYKTNQLGAINISFLASGIYLVKVNTLSESKTLKLVKQ